MEAMVLHKGKTVALMNDNIDTDQIIPKQFLKRIERTGFGEFLFDEWRYLPDRSLNPEFPLNAPDRQEATILVTGENFGCGSSREHAPWALLDYRFRVIIAGGYSDIFYMNCTKNGILPISLPKEARVKLAAIPANEEIAVDLPKQQVISSVGTYDFDIDATWKEKFIKGLDDIAQTMEHESMITDYENKARAY
ncbi:3-isopropylmalate dehydratase small subunit [Paenilisteria newyorkensis]|uniref:3-isopropylmalate dehydratase small subunit n=1 Tax=Listeria newyorkensis TaxID=1497681 RepID=UPI00051D0A1A|nr:3-isopropylmalate dehydratase small subunit [Listeria newyorkensis]KGL41106.1 isopropylmalate isomerase [Listeria newyorkensis]KMT59573.1 isopropylmalate isomerase small subunit [Listeria newyorkensis]WAO21529.1 3-isopropylmalate dehydratase small subunit [Listeria newyorkensis]SQC58883.1 3-isopropylmalate dehydratase small subunit [Listeria newyorkensis]